VFILLKNLKMYFEELEDVRDRRGLRHELTNIIVMSIYGILLGNFDAESIAFFLELNQDYFSEFLDIPYGTPSADTLLRVFALIPPKEFMAIFSQWISDIVKEKAGNQKGKIIQIDGKAVRSATDKINNGNIPYVVSGFLSDLGISIGQVKVQDKSNEITAIPELLDLIDISYCTVTIDAIGCQKEIVQKIVDKKGHYCIALKKNQRLLHTDVEEYFQFALNDPFEKKLLKSAFTLEQGHGRIERREAYLTSDLSFLNEKDQWKNLTMIGMTRNFREMNGVTSVQDKYYILDQELTPEEFLETCRKHWQIENNLHWILDVHFREDSSRAKGNHSIHNLALLRKICYNLVKLDTSFGKLSFKKKLMMYNHDFDNLKRLIFEIVPSQMS
jgi:predicted transposase YbfD/YdcC